MAGALAALAIAASLSACTPAPKPVTAMRLAAGQPTLLVVSCPDFQIDYVSVYLVTETSPRAAWVINREGGAVPVEVGLLEAPPGWSVSDRSLGALADGAEYSAVAYDQARPSVTIHFTLAELAALGPDQVLVGKPASEREAVSEASFRKKARESC